MPKQKRKNRPWWGHYELPVGHVGQWQIGPVSLFMQRFGEEWRVAWERAAEPVDGRCGVDIGVEAEEPFEHEDLTRFAMAETTATVTVSPVLADRPVIVRPESPVSIPPKATAVIYMSTPLWVRIEIGEPRVTLAEVPSAQQSDTWFGPSTREGELCYASRITARLRLSSVPREPHRVISAVTITNEADTLLAVERFRLPVDLLSVFESPDGDLWTDDVLLTRTDDRHWAALKLEPKSWRRARGGARVVSKPRVEVSENVVVRAFGSFFSRLGGD